MVFRCQRRIDISFFHPEKRKRKNPINPVNHSKTIDRIYRINMIFFAFPEERQKVFIPLRWRQVSLIRIS